MGQCPLTLLSSFLGIFRRIFFVIAGGVCVVISGVLWQVCDGQRTLRAGSSSRVGPGAFTC